MEKVFNFERDKKVGAEGPSVPLMPADPCALLDLNRMCTKYGSLQLIAIIVRRLDAAASVGFKAKSSLSDAIRMMATHTILIALDHYAETL